MNKWQYKMKDFNEIYENPEKIKLEEEFRLIKKKIDVFVKNEVLSPLMYILIHFIEVQHISSKEELEKITYSFYYYVLKEYLILDKFIKITGMSIQQLENEGKKNFEIFKDSYKKIKKIDFNEKEFKEKMKRLVKMSHENDK